MILKVKASRSFETSDVLPHRHSVVQDGGSDLQISSVAANILNKTVAESRWGVVLQLWVWARG